MPQRIQRKRTKGWRMPANTVSVTRPGIFGNPFTERNAVEMFRLFLEGRELVFDPATPPYICRMVLRQRERILKNLPSLRGKNLACFCPLDKPCHADVLLELANR